MRTRRLCLLLTCGFGSAVLLSPLRAQDSEHPELMVGAYGGVNLSLVNFLPVVPTDMTIRSNFGFVVRYVNETYFGIQAELGYSQRGWKRKFETPELYYTRTMEYIELPVLAHITFGKKVRGFINLGPKISYLIGQKEDTNFMPTATSDDEATTPHRYAYQEIGLPVDHRFDWGLLAGLGLEVKTGIGSFIAEGRFYYGLGNMFKSSKTDAFDQSSFMNFGVNIAYLIPLSNPIQRAH